MLSNTSSSCRCHRIVSKQHTQKISMVAHTHTYTHVYCVENSMTKAYTSHVECVRCYLEIVSTAIAVFYSHYSSAEVRHITILIVIFFFISALVHLPNCGELLSYNFILFHVFFKNYLLHFKRSFFFTIFFLRASVSLKK